MIAASVVALNKGVVSWKVFVLAELTINLPDSAMTVGNSAMTVDNTTKTVIDEKLY